MYGGGKVSAGPPEAAELANGLRADAPERRRRIAAALDALRAASDKRGIGDLDAPGRGRLLLRRRQRAGVGAQRRRPQGRHLSARRPAHAAAGQGGRHQGRALHRARLERPGGAEAGPRRVRSGNGSRPREMADARFRRPTAFVLRAGIRRAGHRALRCRRGAAELRFDRRLRDRRVRRKIIRTEVREGQSHGKHRTLDLRLAARLRRRFGAGGNLSGPADPSDRLDRRRQRHRRHHAKRRGRADAAARRPAAGDREPRRRQRHRRGASLRAGRARRLHAMRHLPQHDVVQSAAVRPPALRSRPRPGAGRPAVLSQRRPVRLDRARRELRRRAQGHGAGEIRQTQLRHARRGLVPGPVPALDEQSVGHKDRRRALQRRRPGGAGARRQPGAVDPLRHRQFPRLGQSRQGQGHCRVGGETLVAVARRADARRGGPRRVSPAKAGGGSPRRRVRHRRSSTRSMPPSSRCSATRNSWRFSTSRRWCRRRPRRPVSSRS